MKLRRSAASVSGDIQFSVLVPLEDARGDVIEHLRTWTHEQRFPRERFQVVLTSDGGDPTGERELAKLLEPQDVLAHADTSHVVGLWREAAANATAPWLILTEAHCKADPGCLAAMSEAIAAEPDLDAAMCTHGHITHAVSGELTARWFKHMYTRWSKSEWAYLNLVGAAVRRDAFNEIDVFHPRYGLFCAHLLSARLHERGAKVGEVADAVVSHIYHDTLREHHAHSADSARGECQARSELDDGFCERYFGRLDAWSERLRYRPALARQVTSALLSQARRTIVTNRKAPASVRIELVWLGRELARWLPSCASGARPRATRERLDLIASEWATERLPLPADIRWKGYLRAQERVVRSTRLRWIHDHVAAQPPPAPSSGAWTVDELDDAALVGAHAPEHREDGWFRWTEPTTLLRLLPPAGNYVLHVDTHSMRGSPLDYVVGVFVAGERISSTAIHDHYGRLMIELPAHIDRTAEGIVVLCRPYEPYKEGSPDRRRLGLPIFSVGLHARSRIEPLRPRT
jgi:hypothetical protein